VRRVGRVGRAERKRNVSESADWASFLRRISLKNFPIDVRLVVRREDDNSRPGRWLLVEMRVLDRDVGEPARVAHLFPLPARVGDEYDLRVVHSIVSQTLRHELDEAFRFDGMRVFDPHAAERASKKGA